MNNSISLLCLTKYSRQGASSRLRTLQYEEHLQKFGIKMETQSLFDDHYLRLFNKGEKPSFLYLAKRFFSRLKALISASKFDVVWIEKELFPGIPEIFEFYLKLKKVKYIVDYDDAIFNKYETLPRPIVSLFRSKIPNVIRYASYVSCGNSFLEKYSKNQGQKNTCIVPTVIDITRYSSVSHTQSDEIVIGWVGSPSTSKYLKIVAPVLQTLAKELQIRVISIGAKFSIPGVNTEFVEWSESTEVTDIQKFDIGIMPLDTSRWTEGKCGYKLIQYMACGIAPIGTKWGANNDIITHGVDGFLATSPEEWLDYLRKLARDVDLRSTMGTAARTKIESQFCLDATTPKLVSMIKEVHLSALD